MRATYNLTSGNGESTESLREAKEQGFTLEAMKIIRDQINKDIDSEEIELALFVLNSLREQGSEPMVKALFDLAKEDKSTMDTFSFKIHMKSREVV